MPVFRVQLDSDRRTAHKVMELHLAGRAHRASVDAAREEVWRRGRTPAADPVFVGVTNGAPVRLLYDVEVHLDTDDGNRRGVRCV
ncbi:hypothetical protein [Actinoplanes xinjiangensis]|uniref:Uncharacterized protein n=1 Tax=Actinoplanes xinjiangensis TaxID=512350 RepID=A0A316FIL0_9ACTN|nr:hypothetical protein [Actinoplanes xinjiangensis]PWK47566.1 hypothetical protein BC793_107176 [Actinoplanes xinjiangensis]GIF39507.1 hypothetical protein Axi01nite_38180 [Actinoplanes xinjiangensis]